jgi:type II secretory pathway predicted ATPase ExeA
LSTVSPSEFYRQLSSALGLEAPFRKADMFKVIQQHMEYMTLSKKIHVIVIIDEAQYLSSAILRDIKMLMNFSYDSRDCFSLVLLGQPVLADILSMQTNEALRQRITVNYEFSGLKESEAIEYAKAMLVHAGGSEALFDEAALRAAYSSASGSIRTYNHILTGALTIGAQNKTPSIDAEMVMSAASEMAIR